MSVFKDLSNKKFGRLKIVDRSNNRGRKVYWNCICDCGKHCIIEAFNLTSGRTKSCGCLNKEIITKHDKIKYKGKLIPITSHPLFPVYHGMKNRCYNKNLPTYEKWGGRGIKMSKSWYNSFQQFVNDIGPRPSIKHTIDRIDNNKGYSKQNCRWATKTEQNNNTRSNIKIEYNGEIRTLAQTAEYLGIPYHTFYHYFVVMGITDVELIVNFLKNKTPKKLTSNELKKIRSTFHVIQNFECPILKQKFPEESMVVDHLHSKHAKLLNLENPGCIRGIIHRQANSFEGKIANLMIRLGMHKFNISLPQLLRNCAAYLECPPLPYLHPSEKEKQPALKKQSYNKLKKVYNGKAAFPAYPVSGKLTIKLDALFKQYEIEPEFYSK